MIKVKITNPFSLPICTHEDYFSLDKLKNILYDFNIEIIDNIQNSDFEIVGYNQLTREIKYSLPKNKVIFIDGEPPQIYKTGLFPQHYFIDQGFASMMTPLNNKVHSDPFSYYLPKNKYNRRKNIIKNNKISLFSTYREINDQFIYLINLNNNAYSYISLINIRINLGLYLFNNFKNSIDIHGINWPNNIAKLKDRSSYNFSDSKQQELEKYSFDIAVENTLLNNYCTEKLWDPIVKGVLPIVWTCYEMHEILPKNSIIDLRNYFKNSSIDYKSLLYDISDMTEEEYKRRVNILYDWYESIPDNVLDRSFEKASIILAKEINNLYNSDKYNSKIHY